MMREPCVTQPRVKGCARSGSPLGGSAPRKRLTPLSPTLQFPQQFESESKTRTVLPGRCPHNTLESGQSLPFPLSPPTALAAGSLGAQSPPRAACSRAPGDSSPASITGPGVLDTGAGAPPLPGARRRHTPAVLETALPTASAFLGWFCQFSSR